MTTSLTRHESISQRVSDILLDGDAVADIVCDIQKHGGLAHKALCHHMARWFYGETSAIRESAADQATYLVGAFALVRATKEHDARPLCAA